MYPALWLVGLWLGSFDATPLASHLLEGGAENILLPNFQSMRVIRITTLRASVLSTLTR